MQRCDFRKHGAIVEIGHWSIRLVEIDKCLSLLLDVIRRETEMLENGLAATRRAKASHTDLSMTETMPSMDT